MLNNQVIWRSYTKNFSKYKVHFDCFKTLNLLSGSTKFFDAIDSDLEYEAEEDEMLLDFLSSYDETITDIIVRPSRIHIKRGPFQLSLARPML